MANPDGIGGYRPGQSGNPRGRPPKDQSLADLLRRELRKRGADGRPNNRALAEGLIALARAGSIEAIKVIFDRVDGKVPLPVEHSGPGGGGVPIKHDFDFGGLAALFAASVRPELPAPDPDYLVESVHPAYADPETSLLPDPAR